MSDEKTAVVPLHEQVLALSKLAGQIRSALQPVRASISPQTLEGLSQLEATLFNLSRQVTAHEEERSNLISTLLYKKVKSQASWEC